MYQFIISPQNFESYSINSQQGLYILKQYVKAYQNGGMSYDSLPEESSEMKELRKKISNLIRTIYEDIINIENNEELIQSLNNLSVKLNSILSGLYQKPEHLFVWKTIYEDSEKEYNKLRSKEPKECDDLQVQFLGEGTFKTVHKYNCEDDDNDCDDVISISKVPKTPEVEEDFKKETEYSNLLDTKTNYGECKKDSEIYPYIVQPNLGFDLVKIITILPLLNQNKNIMDLVSNSKELLKNLLNQVKILHDKQEGHRDIKPSNIVTKIIDGKWEHLTEIKLIDFGHVGNNIHGLGNVRGTFEYQCYFDLFDKKYTDEYYYKKNDIFSLGLIFLELYNRDLFKKLFMTKEYNFVDFKERKQTRKMSFPIFENYSFNNSEYLSEDDKSQLKHIVDTSNQIENEPFFTKVIKPMLLPYDERIGSIDEILTLFTKV